jgi:GxxExxY protein
MTQIRSTAEVRESTDRDPQTYAIIGAGMEVHTTLGRGFLEPVYQEALERELLRRGIPYRREVEMPIHYKGEKLMSGYKADFVCYESVIVELKALNRISGIERSQLINYLKAQGRGVGLLLNVGSESLQYERFAFTLSGQSAKSAQSADSSETQSVKSV